MGFHKEQQKNTSTLLILNMNYNLLEPWKTLDPWQKKYIKTEGNCFLQIARQSGKTAAAAIKFGERAVNKPNRVILMGAFTERQAFNLFFKCLMYLRAVHPKMIKKGIHKPTKHIINLTNGSVIMCYAVGLAGEGIRTYTITDMVIDEAAPMAREVFIALMPMLSVTGGSLDLISTPRGKEGFFYESSLDPDYTKFYVSAKDCPRHTEEFLARQRRVMTQLEYAQEYEAKFLDDVRQYFKTALVKELCVAERRKIFLPNRPYFLGCDVARKDRDEFTYEIMDRTNRKMLIHVENIITRDVPLPESVRRIIDLNKLYKFKKEYIDSGGMGIAVVDMLREDPENKRKVVEIDNATRPIEYDPDGKRRKIRKEELYANLLNLMEKREILLLSDDEVINSLLSIQYEYKEGGAIKIWGSQAHITEGLIRAVHCVKDKSLSIYAHFS